MAKLRLETVGIVYILLGAAALGWGFLRGAPDIYHHPDGLVRLPLQFGVPVGLLAGIALGMAASRMTRFSVKRYAWARGLHVEFRSLLGRLTDNDIIGYAAASALGEELFFRGALQPVVGLVWSSLIFGLLHIGPARRFVPWTLQALVVGFALGGLFRIFGELSAPIAAHFTINYLNLHFINRYDPPLNPDAFQNP